MTQGRMKTYSSQSGYVYQYSLVGKQRAGGSPVGLEFTFDASADRKHFARVSVLVSDEAVAQWEAARGRELAEAEIHAAAKLRLWQAFDEASAPPGGFDRLIVGPSEIEALLGGIGVE